MAVPKRRVSKMKKGLRRSHLALNVPGMVTCSNCGELTLSHRVCPSCGFYKGRQVVAPKAEKTEE